MEIGSSLGHYRISGELGAGGMGSVYRAEDTRLKRDVAIKVLPPEVASDAERLARMEREAQLLAALSHPNIAAVYGLEEAEGIRFLVMQLAEGETLADRIAAGPIALDEVLRIGLSITEALEAAHARGIVHRDLKPANVQIGPDGKVTLLDFGLAKVYESVGSDSSEHKTLAESPTYLQATQAGVILGTAPYMSPEQARGHAVDTRTDIWAFGCLLYEMLSGRAAFDGPSVTDVLGSIVHQEADWEALPKRTPRRIRMVMHRCLRKDPVRRLQAIGDARIAIQEYQEDPRSVEAILEAPPTVPAFRRLAPWALAAVAAAAAVWLALAPLSRSSHGDGPMRVEVALDEEPLFYGVGSSLALTRDGSRLVYAVTTPGGMALRVRSLDDGRVTELASGGSTYQPFVSPDGEWVGFVTQNELQRVPITGGTPIAVAAVQRARGAAWGAGGELVFAPEPASPLFTVDSSGGEPRVLTELRDGEVTHRWPQVLDDGKVVFTSHTSQAAFDNATIEVFDPATGRRGVLQRGGYRGWYQPDLGSLLYVNDGTLFGVAVDIEAMEATGSPRPLIADLTSGKSEGSAQFTMSDGGRIVFAEGGSAEAAYPALWVDTAGRSTMLWDEAKSFAEPMVSPDGTQVSFIALEDDNWDIWVYDLERDVATRLTFDAGVDAPGVWSPDGRWILFSSTREGDGFNIYRKPADGSGEAERLTEVSSDQLVFDWSVDDVALLSQNGDLWTLDLDSGEQPVPYLETEEINEGEARFAPNGRWVAYASDESGRSEIYVRPFPLSGGKWQISASGGNYPRWSGDGTKLFYRSDDGIMAATVTTTSETFRAGRPAPVFTAAYRGGTSGLAVGGFTGADYFPHPDGERFVMFPADADASIGVQLVVLRTGWFDSVRAVLAASQ